MDSHRRNVYLLIFFGLIPALNHLGSPALFLWDESIYAELVKHILEGRIFPLVSHTNVCSSNLCPWIEKPPLVFYSQAVSLVLFGWFDFEFAFRLPSALSLIGCAITVYYWGRDLYSESAGLLAGVVLILSPPLSWKTRVMHNARTGDTDIFLVFFGTLFLYLLYRAVTEDVSYFKLASVVFGLAFLTKGVGAFIFGVLALPFLYYHGKFRSVEFAKASSIGLVMVLSWPIVAYLMHGDLFLEAFLFDEVIDRATGADVYGNPLFPTSNYPYFRLMEEYWKTAFLPVLFASGYGLVQSVRRRSFTLYLVVWFVSVPLFYSLIGGNHGHYIHPMVPAAALLAGCLWDDGLTWVRENLDISSVNKVNTISISRGIAIVLLISAAIIMPVPTTTHESAQQQHDLAEILPESSDTDQVIVEQELQSEFLFVFISYTDRRIVYVDNDRIQRANQEYALVSESTLNDFDREVKVLGSRDGMYVIYLN